MTLPLRQNDLLANLGPPEADLTDLASPTIHRRPRVTAKRDIVDARRLKTAKEAIGDVDDTHEVYGFTKGQFSVIDIIHHCLDYLTPPAYLQISTWTAANSDITTVLQLCNSGRLSRARWLVDLTFNRRSPELAQRIRQVFGDDAIRVAKNHAKFVLLSDDRLKLVLRTSMNLNFNPRFENFQLAHDPELWEFHNTIFDEVWTRQQRDTQDMLKAYDIHKHFDNDL